MNRMKRSYLVFAALLAGCATTQPPAPVVERLPDTSKLVSPKPKPATPAPVAKKASPVEKDWRPGSYVVKKGDTLFAIGLEHGFDYKDIARWNDIQPPFTIKIGQVLKLQDPAGPPTPAQTTFSPDSAVVSAIKMDSPVQAKPLDAPPAVQAKPIETKPEAPKTPEKTAEKSLPAEDDAVDWAWPAKGKVVSGFSETAGLKGLDIAGTQGLPVLAAANGKVVYSGSSLRGYGKLVIIKHNKTYLSAYGHNSQILVKEGQEVSKGQKIAEMGNTDADSVKLHFEIRKLGKPIDPATFLPAAQ